jgi:hypothetical protein
MWERFGVIRVKREGSRRDRETRVKNVIGPENFLAIGVAKIYTEKQIKRKSGKTP